MAEPRRWSLAAAAAAAALLFSVALTPSDAWLPSPSQSTTFRPHPHVCSSPIAHHWTTTTTTKTSTRLYYDESSSGSSSSSSSSNNEKKNTNNNNNNNNNALYDAMGLNELHTVLRDAVTAQDYVTAGRVSEELAGRMHADYATLSAAEKRTRRRTMSWTGLGGAPWLTDRLDALNYTFPTTIQMSAFAAVNAILNDTEAMALPDDSAASSSLEERVSRTNCMDMGIVVSGTTGSGKTLAYAVPLLSTLSDSLFLRQRLRISDEEAIGDTMGDLVDRISVVTSPRLSTSSRRQVQKGAIATGASMATLGRSGTDVTSPLALVVVPTRELGVQTAMLLYQLVGGNIKDSATALSGKANMFKYKGPKGIRIGCVLDDEEATFGLKLQTDIAITTPAYLSKLLADGDVDPSKLRVIVYDEADLALEQTAATDLARLFDDDAAEREFTRLTFMVGASVTEALGSLAVSSRVLPAGKSYICTATSFAPLTTTTTTTTTATLSNQEETQSAEGATTTTTAAQIVGAQPKTASLKDLNVCLYPGLTHERVVVSGDSGLLVLTRLLRKELQEYEAAVAGNPEIQRPRVVVFFPDEIQAKAAIEPLRDALWGDHRLCVLLPKTGFSPMTIMDQFKKNETSVMLATPNSVRGLDFPSLTHVYTLYLPMDDPREYLHLAGRVGRVGHRAKGHVVSVLKREEASKMDELAQTLGFEFTDLEAPTAESLLARTADGEIDENAIDYEKLRRAFEDTISFVDLVEEPVADQAAIDARIENSVGEDDDEEDDGDEEEESFQ